MTRLEQKQNFCYRFVGLIRTGRKLENLKGT